MRLRRVLLIASLLLCAPALAQPNSTSTKPGNVPLNLYTDPAHGLSFQYPVAWKSVRAFDSYCQPAVFADKIKPTRIVQFAGQGNFYQHTYLDSLFFQYGTIPKSSATACRKLADDAVSDTSPQPSNISIDGVVFRHSRGGVCGLSHGIDAQIYTTFRDGTCFVFEEDFTTCSGVDNTRPLTPQEIKALQRHLDAIMFSVRFAPPTSTIKSAGH